MPRRGGLGQAVFAVMMVSLGVIGLVSGHFTPTWAGVPESLPGRSALAYACAVVSLLTGLGLLVERTAAIAARVLLFYLVMWALAFRVSRIAVAPLGTDTWWACGDSAAMIAGTWVLYARCAGGAFATGERGVRIAQVLYGLALIPFGVAHFTFFQHTIDTVPAWLPWRPAWAVLTGSAFLVAGLAILLGVYARLATALSALMMGLFTLIVWVPFVVTGPDAVQWAEFLGSWSLTAAGWAVADSYSSSVPLPMRNT